MAATDSGPPGEPPEASASSRRLVHSSPGGRLHATPTEALRAVEKDYLYWSGKLTDTSLQLSLGLIAANWAVFGTLNKILANFWAKWSLLLVILSLGLSVVTAKTMSEWHRERVEYAEADPGRWNAEFRTDSNLDKAWPFTVRIERLGRIAREAKTWLPVVAGIAFIVALLA